MDMSQLSLKKAFQFFSSRLLRMHGTKIAIAEARLLEVVWLLLFLGLKLNHFFRISERVPALPKHPDLHRQ